MSQHKGEVFKLNVLGRMNFLNVDYERTSWQLRMITISCSVREVERLLALASTRAEMRIELRT